MSETLLSVGLDVGTTTTQLVLSRLTVKNLAGSFSVPQMQITERQVFYRSDVCFTPLLDESHVDGERIGQLVAKEYEKAGVRREQVDTGAIIITGETSRKENAAAVLKALSGFAGEFVAATAGPDLESVLAAKGAGAVEYSLETADTVLHMDIGGGTSNLTLICQGKIVQTGCFNVGGRLLKMKPSGEVCYISPVIKDLTDIALGKIPTAAQINSLTETLAAALEMAAGLRPKTSILDALQTYEVSGAWKIPEKRPIISFSGGVADCIKIDHPSGAFGDIGPELGKAIYKSLLCQGHYVLGQETIGATVIGAGCHSACLSGSTVFCRNVELPLKNVPVAVFSAEEQDDPMLPDMIARRMAEKDAPQVVLAMPGYPDADYERIGVLAEKIIRGTKDKAVYVCLEADMAKALGQRLCLMNENRPCLCIDAIRIMAESYLDIGKPVGPALPVVIKTLVLEQRSMQ